MQQLERLQSIIPEVNISYDHLMPKKLSGLYFDNHIKLNARNDYYKNVEVLGEEIGHHYTSHGHIMDYSKIDNMRQEQRARRLGIYLVMPLEKLIECYEAGHWGDICSVCMYLEIDRPFLSRAIDDYKKQFGGHVDYDGYRIEFEPLKITKNK